MKKSFTSRGLQSNKYGNNVSDILNLIHFLIVVFVKLQWRKFVPSALEIGNAKQDTEYIATLSKVLSPAAFLYFLTPT